MATTRIGRPGTPTGCLTSPSYPNCSAASRCAATWCTRSCNSTATTRRRHRANAGKTPTLAHSRSSSGTDPTLPARSASQLGDRLARKTRCRIGVPQVTRFGGSVRSKPAATSALVLCYPAGRVGVSDDTCKASRSAPTRIFHGSMLTVTSCSVGTQGSSARRRWISSSSVCVHDQQHADAAVFGSGERAGEEDEALSASAFMKAACSVTAGCSKIPPACQPGPASRMTAK